MSARVEYRFVASAEFRKTLFVDFDEFGKQGWVWMGNDWGFSIFCRPAHPEASEPGSQNPPINQELLEACEAVVQVNANGMTASEGIRVVEMCRRAVAREKASHA